MNYLLKYSIFVLLIFLFGCGHEQKVKKTKVELLGYQDNTTVIFDRDSIKVYFGKSDLLKYCEKKQIEHTYEKETYTIKTAKGDTTFSPTWDALDTIFFRGDTIDIANRIFKNAFYKLKDTMMTITVSIDTIVVRDTTLVSFLQKLKDTTIVIKDSMVTKPFTTDKSLIDISLGSGDTIIDVPDWGSNQTQYSEALGWALIDILRAGKGKVFDVKDNNFVDYVIIKDLEDNLSGDVEIYLPNGKMFYHAMLRIH